MYGRLAAIHDDVNDDVDVKTVLSTEHFFPNVDKHASLSTVIKKLN